MGSSGEHEAAAEAECMREQDCSCQYTIGPGEIHEYLHHLGMTSRFLGEGRW
jgi:hypothetical protein